MQLPLKAGYIKVDDDKSTRRGFGLQPKPEWLRIRLNTSEKFRDLKRIVREGRLNTVCEEARCPNIHECWGDYKTATFMVLGDTCTRRCRFCSVKTGLPTLVDWGEAQRVATSVAQLELKHVVITMVTRDDLKDGGALLVANTVRAIRKAAPDCGIELLTSDLMVVPESIQIVLDSKPQIMSHNLETVRRLTPIVRSRSYYDRSLQFLRMCKEQDADTTTKSSIMLGLGEGREEVLQLMDDLLASGVSMMNMGQYLQPSRNHQAVQKYWTPQEFNELKERALEKGFAFVEAGPLVRSSYHAGEQYAHYKASHQNTASHQTMLERVRSYQTGP